MQITKQNSEI